MTKFNVQIQDLLKNNNTSKAIKVEKKSSKNSNITVTGNLEALPLIEDQVKNTSYY